MSWKKKSRLGSLRIAVGMPWHRASSLALLLLLSELSSPAGAHLGLGGTSSSFVNLTALTPGIGTVRFTDPSNTRTITPYAGIMHLKITRTGTGTTQRFIGSMTQLGLSHSAGQDLHAIKTIKVGFKIPTQWTRHLPPE